MNITELKQLWQEHGFRPKKRAGQNFLIDNNVRDNILNAVPLAADSIVIEIGAGFGAMSFETADRCGKVYAVEKDVQICGIMAPLFKQKKNLKLVCEDILDVDVCSLAGPDSRVTVIGNIPYYITTLVIEKVIEQRRCVQCAYIVLQDEVASRIVSPPGSKEYGALSCFVQFYAKAEKEFRIKKNSFYPKPKVDSCLLKLEVLHEPEVKVRDKELMFRIIRKAFLQRRKKIINSLSHKEFLSIDRNKWQNILKNCDISEFDRAEDLSLSDYARISDAVMGEK